MRWRVSVFIAVGFLAAVTSRPGLAQESTNQQEYLRIYLKINDADQLERKGDFRGALADFKDCYTRLQRIHQRDPDWEKALVLHRMEDCQAKILYLTDQAANQAPESVEPPVNAAPGGTLPSPTTSSNPSPGASSAEVQQLKDQLAQVQQELDDTKEKFQNSQLQTNDLKTQLDAANQELAALKNGQSEDERMGKLLEENKSLGDKLAAAQKKIALFKPANPKSALGLLQAQLKNTQDQLSASQAQNTALQQTTSTLQSQLDQAQSDLRAANERLAQAPPNSADYDKLKRENEIMRDILTRELQEQAHRDMAKRLMQEEFARLKITSEVLREQLDILGSPMTPPATDQERELIDSLRTSGSSLAVDTSSGNNFTAAPNNGAGATNAPSGTPPPTTDSGMASTPSASTDTDTNAPAVADTNAPATTPSMAASTNAPSVADTNAASVSVMNTAATNAPDTNVASATPPPTSTPDLTAATNTVAATTNTETAATNTTASTDTNAPATTNVAAATPPDTNTGAAIPPPSGTTTVTNTTISNGGGSNDTDYSVKPRLPDDMRDTAQQAADLFKMQRYDEAADKYQTIIDKYPDSLYAWSNLGVVRFQQGKLPEALKALQQAVKLSPTDAFSYSNLGIVYYQLGQYENAISALERALALDPNNAMSHNYLGCACSQKGWTEVAEKEFTKAIELNDSFADAHFNLALIYAEEKPPSLEMARRHYKRALELGIQPDPRLEKLLQMDVSQVSPASGMK